MPSRILKFPVKELFILQLCSFFRSRLLENHVSIARPGKKDYRWVQCEYGVIDMFALFLSSTRKIMLFCLIRYLLSEKYCFHCNCIFLCTQKLKSSALNLQSDLTLWKLSISLFALSRTRESHLMISDYVWCVETSNNVPFNLSWRLRNLLCFPSLQWNVP